MNPAPETISKFALLHKLSIYLNASLMLGLVGVVFILSERRQKRVWS